MRLADVSDFQAILSIRRSILTLCRIALKCQLSSNGQRTEIETKSFLASRRHPKGGAGELLTFDLKSKSTVWMWKYMNQSRWPKGILARVVLTESAIASSNHKGHLIHDLAIERLFFWRLG